MKTIIKIIALLLLTQTAIAQKKSIKAEQLFITNKVTGKSFKIGTSVNTLKNFGTLIKVDTLDLTVESDEYYIKHIFNNIIIFESVQGKISAFETQSSEIALERKGMFSFSPGDHINKIAAIFPEEVNSAEIIPSHGIERTPYLTVWIQLLSHDKTSNQYVTNYYEGVGLLFDPETKILKEIYYWIRP